MDKDFQNNEVFDPQSYWEQRLSHQFTLRGVGSRTLSAAYNHWLYRMRRIVFHREVHALSLDLSDISILDVGSGTGFYVHEWSKLGGEQITGIDLTQTSVDNLRKKFPEHNFFKIDICQPDISISDRRFDVISSLDVLFHIIDDQAYEQAIRNLYTLLNPGGYLIFSENFVHQKTKNSDHVVFRSIFSITQLLDETGFQILKRVPIFNLMNAPIDSRSILHHNFWRIIRKLVATNNLAGFLIGAFLFPFEILLTRTSNEGPSTEMMVCKKSDHGDSEA